MKSLFNGSGIALTCVMLSMAFTAAGQQLQQYTQFMFNRQVVNPAYAGFTGDRLNATAMSRWQWGGIDGAPRTRTLALDSYLDGKKMGLGLVVNNDEITVFRTTTLQVNYAYHVIMGERQRLSFGLSGSLSNFSARYSELEGADIDPNFAGYVSTWSPNFGFGVYYTLGNLNLGFSVPFTLSNSLKDNNAAFFKQRDHYFITAGYAWQVNPNVRIEPNVLFKIVTGSPLGVDINALTWIKEIIAVGLAYRPNESVDVLLQLKPKSNIRIGYSFDYITDKTLSALANNSHEIMLTYALPLKKAAKDKDTHSDGVH